MQLLAFMSSVKNGPERSDKDVTLAFRKCWEDDRKNENGIKMAHKADF